MGVRAGLTEIPSEILEQVRAGGEPDFPESPRHSIDKAWHDLHAVFRAKGLPLSLAVSGDYLHPLSNHTLDEFCKGGHEYYVGFASPDLVQQVAEHLASVSAADYKRWEVELFGDQYNVGEKYFPHLKTAYLEAAARKNSLMIVIA
jgi:hypothetical protein